MKVIFAAAFGLALFSVSTASAQRPDRKVEQPIVRSFNWFSYVAGDDIRSACEPAGRNRVRLVYNAIWEEQVRAYDIFLQPDGTAGLDIGVLNDQGHGGNLSSLSLGSDGSGVTSPWMTADTLHGAMGSFLTADRELLITRCRRGQIFTIRQIWSLPVLA